jgi:hypothetical protein
MIEAIRNLQKSCEVETSCTISYELHIENNEIIFKYDVCYAWECIRDFHTNFNACDWETNERGVLNEIKKLKEFIMEKSGIHDL